MSAPRGMPWRLRRAAVSLKAERVAVHDLLLAHGPGGQGALLMLLAAPCVLPVPGVGTVLGIGIAAVAWAMWCGQAADCLPQRVASLSMPQRWARRVLAFLARVYAAAGRVSRPRWGGVATAGLRSWIRATRCADQPPHHRADLQRPAAAPRSSAPPSRAAWPPAAGRQREPPGYVVTDAQGQRLGYSRDCSIDTFVAYLYRSTANAWLPMPAGGTRPGQHEHGDAA
jgi:hypothetical protein